MKKLQRYFQLRFRCTIHQIYKAPMTSCHQQLLLLESLPHFMKSIQLEIVKCSHLKQQEPSTNRIVHSRMQMTSHNRYLQQSKWGLGQLGHQGVLA
ncbi:hypothetical protein FGO68_gene10027 [Halteria grandinella]|uniref:Uncharacterized protein n=1 Tax=Halteria grandinella TaxID=5974 RepID=A0A8J8P3L7_HALGN|nr:hypothetical protein FGO68_gene10027 [Halteria grandinella]